MLEGLEVSEVLKSDVEKISHYDRWDSQYYDKEFLQLFKQLKSIPTKKLGEICSQINRNPMMYGFEYVASGVPFIRIDDLNNSAIDTSTSVYIDEATHKKFSSTHLLHKDIVMGVRGNTIGRLGLYLGEDNRANISPNCIYFRLKDILNAEIITIFLLSKFGQDQINHSTSGTGQPTITSTEIYELMVPVFSNSFRRNITGLLKKFQKAGDSTQEKCNQAETLLLKTLGLVDYSPSTQHINIKSFKDSFVTTGRLDAEYYQPKYDELEAKIGKTHELIPLGSLLSLNQRGTQPDYADEGLPVINSKHVREGEVILSNNRFANLPDKENSLVIQKGDVLINGTGVGTIGRSASYLHNQNAIPDNHVTILRTDKLNPIFLSVYLNSIAGKYQVDKYFKGSSGQIELYPQDIDCFYVPLVDETIQTEIDALVRQSFTLKAESEKLLAVAKRAVEIAIEQGENAGIAYIEANS